VKDKFTLFVRDTINPISFLEAAFNAGLDQASNRDPTFGRGGEAYAKSFGADFAGQTTWRFFTDFAYPTIFSEDPRYYRLIHGSGRQRFLHAVEHTLRVSGYALATGMGFDVLREFWPDIARKLHMPFRDTREAPVTATGGSPQ
jgi:hypothetical protein